MTIVKCHVQCLNAEQTSTQNATICMHYVCPEIQLQAVEAAVVAVVAIAADTLAATSVS